LQQTPSTQKPEVHWLAAVQLVPLAFFAVQVVVAQYAVDLHWLSAAQAERHAGDPPHQVWPHSEPGSVSEAKVVHVPLELPPAATVHAWQVPVHAELQHTPSAQKPEVHWLAAEQALPRIFFAVQVPPAQ
jgi:hypothetical protein